MPTGELDDRAASVLAEARELTAQRMADAGKEDDDDGEETSGETDSDE